MNHIPSSDNRILLVIATVGITLGLAGLIGAAIWAANIQPNPDLGLKQIASNNEAISQKVDVVMAGYARLHSNAMLVVQQRNELAQVLQLKQQWINEVVSRTQAFLTNDRISALELGVSRIMTYQETNETLRFKPTYTWEITPTNVIARKEKL